MAEDGLVCSTFARLNVHKSPTVVILITTSFIVLLTATPDIVAVLELATIDVLMMFV